MRSSRNAWSTRSQGHHSRTEKHRSCSRSSASELSADMVIRGSARVTCPACGVKHDGELVQSINTQTNPRDKQRLLDGTLNLLVCSCGKRTQLAANVVFHDPDAHYYCQ